MAFYHTMCFVFTVLIICNLVLYPSIFSGVFKKLLGSSPAEPEREKVPDMPPQMRQARGPTPNRRMEMERAAQRTMKHADPASYFAQQKQEASKGRGLLGSVLPVYAVGIVVYFAYIMYRIFLKDKSKVPETPPNMWDTSKEGLSLQQRVQQEQLQKQLSEQLKAENYTGIKPTKKAAKPSKAGKSRKQQQQQEPLLSSLTPCNDSDSSCKESADEMTALKKRLEDTERSMHRMMEMMNSMGIAMSQVTEQLTGTVPANLAGTMNNAMQQAEEDASDEGQRSSEEEEEGEDDGEADLASSQGSYGDLDGGPVGDDSSEGEGDVEVMGAADLEFVESVRRRLVPAVGAES